MKKRWRVFSDSPPAILFPISPAFSDGLENNLQRELDFPIGYLQGCELAEPAYWNSIRVNRLKVVGRRGGEVSPIHYIEHLCAELDVESFSESFDVIVL